MENAQRRSNPVVTELRELNYGERLRKLDLPTLEPRERRGTMIEMFTFGYNSSESKTTKGVFELINRVTRTSDKNL